MSLRIMTLIITTLSITAKKRNWAKTLMLHNFNLLVRMLNVVRLSVILVSLVALAFGNFWTIFNWPLTDLIKNVVISSNWFFWSKTIWPTDICQQTSGQQTSGQQTTGQQTSGQQTSSQQTSGQQTSGQQTSGQQPNVCWPNVSWPNFCLPNAS